MAKQRRIIPEEHSMKLTITVSTLCVLALLASSHGPFARRAHAATAPNHTVMQADLDRWKVELSNWGRWGKDDQKGTLNLITPAKRKEAAAEVKDGFAVSLAHDALT